MQTTHEWKDQWSGGYDTIHKCKHCKKEFMTSADAPEKILPVEGCIEHEDDTAWYEGITEKHYEIALVKAVNKERERCIELIRTDMHANVATANDWTVTIFKHFAKRLRELK